MSEAMQRLPLAVQLAFNQARTMQHVAAASDNEVQLDSDGEVAQHTDSDGDSLSGGSSRAAWSAGWARDWLDSNGTMDGTGRAVEEAHRPMVDIWDEIFDTDSPANAFDLALVLKCQGVTLGNLVRLLGDSDTRKVLLRGDTAEQRDTQDDEAYDKVSLDALDSLRQLMLLSAKVLGEFMQKGVHAKNWCKGMRMGRRSWTMY